MKEDKRKKKSKSSFEEPKEGLKQIEVASEKPASEKTVKKSKIKGVAK